MPDATSQSRKSRPRTYALVSLGCVKNLVDSERMGGLLAETGCRLVDRAEGADFVVVNTCGFVAAARQESYGVIGEMAALKRGGRLGGLIVAGCLAERDREALLERFPEIDQLVGVFAREKIAEAAARLGNGEAGGRATFLPPPSCALCDDRRLRLTPRHVAYLKIAEGCNRACSFCTIPRIRGPYTSKPIEQVVAEAEALAADGTRELIVVAQDTTCYGSDLYGRPRLADLLRRLDAVDGLAWVRPMYLYPMHIDDELIDVVAGGRRIVPYLDLPLQHISDAVLRRMRRRVTRDETERLLDRLRERIDGLVLRTTLLVGFPGETEAEFEELLDFVRRRRFERLGVFAYSREPGTASEGLDDHVPERIKHSRRERLMAEQQDIAFEHQNRQVGRRVEALIDRDIPDQDHAFLGRTYADAPEIDSAVYVTGQHLRPGDKVGCEVVAASGYDLVAVQVA